MSSSAEENPADDDAIPLVGEEWVPRGVSIPTAAKAATPPPAATLSYARTVTRGQAVSPGAVATRCLDLSGVVIVLATGIAGLTGMWLVLITGGVFCVFPLVPLGLVLWWVQFSQVGIALVEAGPGESEELPAFLRGRHLWGDVFLPGFRIVCAGAICLWPAGLFIWLSMRGLPAVPWFVAAAVEPWWFCTLALLVAAGCFPLPVVAMTLLCGAELAALLPGQSAATARCIGWKHLLALWPLTFLASAAALFQISVLGYLPLSGGNGWPHGLNAALTTGVISTAVFSIFGLLAAMYTGALYAAVAADLPWKSVEKARRLGEAPVKVVRLTR